MENKFLTPLLTAFLLTASAAPLWAHAHLQSTDPEDRAKNQAPPKEVSIHFGSAVEGALSRISITDATNGVIPTSEVLLSKDAKSLSAEPLTPLAAGKYRVRWSALSHDGHPVSGEFSFTVSK